MKNIDTGSAVLKKSPIHGKGLFAVRMLELGERVIEYTGKIRKWADFKDSRTDYACLMGLEHGRVIDPRTGGNIARYINHGCEPNCEAVIVGRKVFIDAIQQIKKGDELTFDYSLMPPSKGREAARKKYVCTCGSPMCRGTMLLIDK